MRNLTSAAFLLAAGALGGTALAQDSVSKIGCLPGDATAPWADANDPANDPNGSEQCDQFTVDLTDVTSSWNNAYALGVLLKSSKSSSTFNTSLMAGNGISRDMLTGVRFSAGSYDSWDTAGAGVNNDALLQDAGSSVDASCKRGVQFGVAFQENGATDAGFSYQGVVGAVVNIDPTNPRRLYVNKVQAATNSVTFSDDHAAIGGTSIDANGNVAFRADDFNLNGWNPTPGELAITGNNIYMVDILDRNCDNLNVLTDSGNLLDGLGSTTKWLVRQDIADTHTCPTLIPESVTGGAPVYIGTTFSYLFEAGSAFGGVTQSSSHLAPGVSETRGNVSYTQDNFAPLGSTLGLAALIAKPNGLGDTTGLNVWGLGAGGTVTGNRVVVLPGTVTDNSTGFQNLGPGPNQFDNYHSQVAFQGSNGQVALRVDSQGNLLLAGQVDHPDDGPDNQWGVNYIAVCKVDPAGNESWTMAGYTDNAGSGKPVLDGPSGNPIAVMRERIPGPSVSSPMFDKAGNLFFLSNIELLDGTQRIALLRAVYDPATFSFELESVLQTGDVFTSPGTGLQYQINQLRLLDSNSISSDAPFSQNITEGGFLGYDADFVPEDTRNLGGIAVAAEVTYDFDGSGTFDDCIAVGGSDEEYRVMLYITSGAQSGQTSHGQGCPGTGGFEPVISWNGYPTAGGDIELKIDSGLGGQTALLFISFAGSGPFFAGGGCFINVTPPLSGPIALPLFGAGAGNGEISIPTTLPNTLPPGINVFLQAFCTDPGTALGASSTKGLQITTQS